MANDSKSKSKTSRKSYKSLSPEDREKQLIAESYDLAEKKIRDGTASSQIICHFLKLGTVKAELETEKIKKENKLIDAKTDAIETEQKREELLEEAIAAFTSYAGREESE